jgi:DNA-binding NarL/FixJ family response regulator
VPFEAQLINEGRTMGLSTHTEFTRDATETVLRTVKADDAIYAPAEGNSKENLVVIVDQRLLQSECLGRGIVEHNPAFKIATVSSLDELRSMPNRADASVVLVAITDKLSDHAVRADLSTLVLELGGTPVIVVANSDQPAEILAALEIGVRGYVPTSVTARVVAEAIELARAGGTFVPVSGFLALRDVICGSAENKPPMSSFLTTRQGAVAEALRKGKANKIIAYELNMCESTVKVHVRNIMKKVQATNRTQVAYKLSEMGI